MDYFFVILIGLIIGSFLNVCIFRIPKEESIAYPPSHCGNCNHRLYALDLVPVVSYLFLKGRCRYCKSKISLRYPFIECLNAILYLLIYSQYGLSFNTLKYLFLSSLLIVIGAIDFDTQFIYTSTTIFGFISGIAFIIFEKFVLKYTILNYIYGALLGILIIGAIVILTKGMGSGDIEIAGLCGLFLGLKAVAVGLFLAVVIGGVVGIIAIIFEIKNIKEKMAFGPFLASGAVISLLYGTSILDWYYKLLI